MIKDLKHISDDAKHYCGGCIHFKHEDTYGFGMCYRHDDCGEERHCSDDACVEKFVSVEMKNHHLIVLRKCQRCLNGNVGTGQDMDVKEISKAIDFVVDYVKSY